MPYIYLWNPLEGSITHSTLRRVTLPHPSTYKVIITFGKHSGATLGFVADNDPAYLTWVMSSSLPKIWRTAAGRALAGKSVESLDLPKMRHNWHKPRQKGSGSAGIVIRDKNTAAVKFPYDEVFIKRFKAEIDGRKWDSEHKCWTFPVAQLPKVVKLLGGPKAVKMNDAVKRKYRKELKRRKSLDEIRDRDEASFSFLNEMYVLDELGNIYDWDKWKSNEIIKHHIKE